MARPVRVIVSLLPNVVGKIFYDGNFADAVLLSAQLKAQVPPYEGNMYVVYDDGTVRLFDPATHTVGAPISLPAF